MEVIELPEQSRYSAFPIRNQHYWDLYRKVQESYWIDKDLNKLLDEDRVQWPHLDPRIKNLVRHVVAFFAIGDGVINENIEEGLLDSIKVRELKMIYNYQMMMEDVHNVVYSRLVETYSESEEEKQRLLQPLNYSDTIKRKVEWARHWLNHNEFSNLAPETVRALREALDYASDVHALTGAPLPAAWQTVRDKLAQERAPLAMRILVNVIMEGLFFQGSFCVIFWVRHQYALLPGLGKSNELISRDEGFHTLTGVDIYRSLEYRLPADVVCEMFVGAVEIEREFIAAALPQGLIGMNAELMEQYIEFVADGLLELLGYDAYYHTANPFPFMAKQSINVRMGDFFVDSSISEYGHAATESDYKLDFNDDI